MLCVHLLLLHLLMHLLMLLLFGCQHVVQCRLQVTEPQGTLGALQAYKQAGRGQEQGRCRT